MSIAGAVDDAPVTVATVVPVALLALVQGFTVFNFTVLLHEDVHDVVLRKRNTRLNRAPKFKQAV